MQDPVLVGKLESRGNGLEEMRALLVGESPSLDTLQELCEIEAVDVFHDKIGVAVVAFEVIDGHDVRMCKQARSACLGKRFLHRRLGACLVDSHAQGDDLDGNAALQARIPADKHAAEAARAALLDNAVAAQKQRWLRLWLGVCRSPLGGLGCLICQRHGSTFSFRVH